MLDKVEANNNSSDERIEKVLDDEKFNISNSISHFPYLLFSLPDDVKIFAPLSSIKMIKVEKGKRTGDYQYIFSFIDGSSFVANLSKSIDDFISENILFLSLENKKNQVLKK